MSLILQKVKVFLWKEKLINYLLAINLLKFAPKINISLVFLI